MEKLSIKNLSFSYGEEPVLDDISFELGSSKLVALLGKNGAGKSTIFKCILGFIKGYSGVIEIDGKDIRNFSQKELARYVSYIPQTHHAIFNYSVTDVVAMGRAAWISAFASPSASDYERAHECLKLMGIENLYNRGYRELSGGERQLVLIARALCQQSKVLIMDEPAASLDYGNQIRLMERLNHLASEGYCIFFSTHNPEQVLRFADEAVVLNNAHLSAFGSVREVLNGELLSDIYSVPLELVRVEASGRMTDVILS